MSLPMTGLPFDDIRSLIARFPGPDEEAARDARERQETLLKPQGSLGRLEEIAIWLARWSGKSRPNPVRPTVVIFAANHGVYQKGVSPFPQGVTQTMVETFAAGGAAINQLCLANNFGLKVFDLALDYPTPDITERDAFDEAGCAATIAYGMEAAASGVDLLMIGEMGLGNTTVAAAIYHALYGGRAEDWVGRGSGVDEAGYARKVAAVEMAVRRIAGETDPLEILRRLGGREIAAMAGAISAARYERIPVILDGFVVSAAAAVLHAMRDDALDHCLFAHVSAERPHAAVLEKLGAAPLLDLGMRLGEGSGAAVAGSIVKAAASVHSSMATFKDVGL